MQNIFALLSLKANNKESLVIHLDQLILNGFSWKARVIVSLRDKDPRFCNLHEMIITLVFDFGCGDSLVFWKVDSFFLRRLLFEFLNGRQNILEIKFLYLFLLAWNISYMASIDSFQKYFVRKIVVFLHGGPDRGRRRLLQKPKIRLSYWFLWIHLI